MRRLAAVIKVFADIKSFVDIKTRLTIAGKGTCRL